MAFFQYLFCSETQADLYQSNLQGGKPRSGWVSLSDVDNSQLYLTFNEEGDQGGMK